MKIYWKTFSLSCYKSAGELLLKKATAVSGQRCALPDNRQATQQ